MKKKMALLITVGLIGLSLMGCSQSQSNDTAAKINALETTVQEMQDKEEIRLLVDQFSNLADEKDASAQAELFTDDAQVIISFGGQENVINGKDAIAETFGGVLSSMEALYHMNGQIDIKLDGDTATGTVYCRVALINNNDETRNLTDEAVYYNDEYVRQNGKWLISKRTSNFVFTDSHEMSAQQ